MEEVVQGYRWYRGTGGKVGGANRTFKKSKEGWGKESERRPDLWHNDYI